MLHTMWTQRRGYKGTGLRMAEPVVIDGLIAVGLGSQSSVPSLCLKESTDKDEEVGKTAPEITT